MRGDPHQARRRVAPAGPHADVLAEKSSRPSGNDRWTAAAPEVVLAVNVQFAGSGSPSSVATCSAI
jgi:hypothetical protein